MTSLPDWLVERAALEEVPSVCRDRIERADRDELAARVAELRADNAAVLAAYPPGPTVAAIERRIKPRRRYHVHVACFAVAAAAAIAFVAWPRSSRPEQVAMVDEEVTRAKGAARLTVFRQAGDHAERLDEDTVVRAGDTLQLRYSAGGKLYGVIASVDGAGVVTLHYPASADAPALATALAQKPTSLPQAYVLDDAPEFEHFLFITSQDPIEVAPTLEALRTRTKLPAGLHQWTFRLRKGAP